MKARPDLSAEGARGETAGALRPRPVTTVGGRIDRWTWPWALALAAGVFVVQKLVLLAVIAARTDGRPLRQLFRFDSIWYQRVMQGYAYPGVDVGRGRLLSNLAFFPGYPGMSRAFSWFGLTDQQAMYLAAWLGTAVAVLGIFALARHWAGNLVAVFAVALWGAAPRSLVQVMAYSEGLFVAALAGALILALRRRWLWAGAVGALAGLIRPTGITVAATLGTIFLIALIAHLRGRPGAPRPEELVRMAGAAVLSGCGFAGYWIFVAVRTGRLDGYFRVQEQWRTTMGWPHEKLTMIPERLRTNPGDWTYSYVMVIALVVALVLLVWLWCSSVPLILKVQATFMVLLAMASQGYFHSTARFLLPVFMLWFPLAKLLARWPWVGAVLLLAWFALGTSWNLQAAFGAYSP